MELRVVLRRLPIVVVAAGVMVSDLPSLRAGWPSITVASNPFGSTPQASYAPAPAGALPASPAEHGGDALELDVALPRLVAAAEEEGETVVVKELEKLPPPLQQHLKELPDEERERLLKVLHEVGVKVPVTMPGGGDNPDGDEEAQAKAMQLLSQFSEVKQLPRTASSILAARAERWQTTHGKNPKDADKQPLSLMEFLGGGSPDELGDFQTTVIAGDWAAVRERLSAMPGDTAANVYSHLLMLLSNNGGAFNPHDVLALADAAPRKLSSYELSMLGGLLKSSLATVEESDRWPAALKRGNRRLGGEDVGNRLAAARLLREAGLFDAATTFLIPLADAVKQNDADQLNMYGAILVDKSRKAKDDSGLLGACNLFQQVLETADQASPGYAEALHQMTSLLGRVPREVGGVWLREAFETDPPLGLRILAAVSGGLDSQQGGNPYRRAGALLSLKAAVDELAPVAKKQSDVWSPTLQLLAMQWCLDVDAVLTQANQGNSYDDGQDSEELDYGNAMPYGDDAQSGDRTAQEKLFERLLSTAPDEAALACAEPETAWKVRRLTGLLAARAVNQTACFAQIKRFVEPHPETARALAASYVQSLAMQLNPAREQDGYMNYAAASYAYSGGMRYSPYGGSYYYNYNAGAMVPLTRARQVRNLSKLRSNLDELSALGVGKLDDKTLVGAFAYCHSPAEVYLRDDVERVFGPLDELDADAVRTLADTMRTSLAGQWRKPDLQEAYGTQRTDAQLVAEIDRGYELALTLAESVEQKHLGPELWLLTGNLQFDHAEFLYGQKADLATYVTIRDKAFRCYRLAHDAYANSLVHVAPEKFTPAVYVQWFQSALGASDLAYLSRQDEPDRDQIDQVADALRSLGPQSAAKHLTLFGDAVAENLENVPAHLKPWTVREALRILGDDSSGRPLKELASLYDDLQEEIELHIRVDGPTNVGRKPFGAHLVIRGTTAVMREGQGFAMLLQQQGYSQATSEPVNHKERIEKEVREKLGEGFEITEIRFHEPTVEPRTFGRDGWRELPLAYLLLKAKDAAIDRIPSIELDMEYSDGRGFVVLPIQSSIELIDARSREAPRPLAELTVKQTLDARKFDAGALRLEVAAKSKGLIPDLETLLKMPGDDDEFTTTSVIDHGIVIGGLDVKSPQIRPECERRWTVEFAPTAGRRPTSFRFPTAIDESAIHEMSLSRYDDADVTAAEPIVELGRLPLAPRHWIGIAAALSAAIAGTTVWAVVVQRRRHRARSVIASAYRRPDQVTPFTVLTTLKKIAGAQTAELSSEDRSRLADVVRQLEAHYFARSAPPPARENGHTDLDLLLDSWLKKAAPVGLSPANGSTRARI